MYDKKRFNYVYTEEIWTNLLTQQNGFKNERLRQLIQSVCKNIVKAHDYKKTRRIQRDHSGSSNGHYGFSGKSNTFRKTMNKTVDIYGLLNKLTDITYNKLEPEILSIFRGEHVYIQNNLNDILYDEESMKKVIHEACNNTLYIHLYVKLLVRIFEIDKHYIQVFYDMIHHFKEKVFKVRSIDNINDYDLLCEINKENDTIKGFCILCLNLFQSVKSKSFMIECNDKIYEFIIYIFDILRENIDKKDTDKVNSICGFVHKMFLMEHSGLSSFIIYDRKKENKLLNKLEVCINISEEYIRCNMKLNDVFVIFHNT